MKITPEESMALPEGTALQMSLPSGQFATIGGVFVIANGEGATVEGKVNVPIIIGGREMAQTKIVLCLPKRGNILMAFSPQEISVCFETVSPSLLN